MLTSVLDSECCFILVSNTACCYSDKYWRICIGLEHRLNAIRHILVVIGGEDSDVVALATQVQVETPVGGKWSAVDGDGDLGRDASPCLCRGGTPELDPALTDGRERSLRHQSHLAPRGIEGICLCHTRDLVDVLVWCCRTCSRQHVADQQALYRKATD